MNPPIEFVLPLLLLAIFAAVMAVATVCGTVMAYKQTNESTLTAAVCITFIIVAGAVLGSLAFVCNMPLKEMLIRK